MKILVLSLNWQQPEINAEGYTIIVKKIVCSDIFEELLRVSTIITIIYITHTSDPI